MDQLLSKLDETIVVVSQPYFLMGFVSGFLYGVWVAWSLSGRASKSA